MRKEGIKAQRTDSGSCEARSKETSFIKVCIVSLRVRRECRFQLVPQDILRLPMYSYNPKVGSLYYRDR